ncbi:hypothetical protein ABZV58_07520 [Nocardia sp. NPDC004654]|uniref:hypothetical protein n=1 Tax=Nocardia sp. NPDC004654 TaxID=3154776 RepID=UPI0033A1FF5F
MPPTSSFAPTRNPELGSTLVQLVDPHCSARTRTIRAGTTALRGGFVQLADPTSATRNSPVPIVATPIEFSSAVPPTAILCRRL